MNDAGRTAARGLSCLSLLLILSIWGPAAIQQPGSGNAEKAQEKEGPFSRFHWLRASGANRGMIFQTSRIESPQVELRNQPSAEEEIEINRPGPGRERITRRVYDIDVNGAKRLFQVVVEDLRVTADGGMSAEQTVSQRGMGGAMQVIRREVQQTEPAGPESYQTKATRYLPNGRGALVPSQEIVQIEKKTGDGEFNIERTQMLPDVNGTWKPAEKRVSTSREVNNRTIIEAEIYRENADGRFALNGKESTTEWETGQGTIRQESEVYRSDIEGKLRLNERSDIVQVDLADGIQQTTQNLYQVNPASPTSGMRLVERIVENMRPLPGNTRETQIEVQSPTVNGQLQTVLYRRIVENK